MKPWFEDLPLDWTREETRAAERLLIVGYPMNIAALTLAQNTGLDLSTLNQMAPVAFLAREIMEKARLSGRLLQLIVEIMKDQGVGGIHEPLRLLLVGFEPQLTSAALKRKPSIATLAVLPPTFELRFGNAPAPSAFAQPGFEKLINAAAGFDDPALLRRRIAEAEVRTARIEIGGRAKGTGFLVGPSLLLTNFHVVAGGTQGALARFDYKVSPAGQTIEPGRAVTFAEPWSAAQSGHQPAGVELSADGPPFGLCDFALVRLAEPVAAQPIGDPKENGEARGHYALDGGVYDYVQEEPVLIMGHPCGRPLQLSYASPSGVHRTAHGSRVRYQTNTEGGSSGSPVFNRGWRVVALHHAGGPTTTPGPLDLPNAGFNQGIPMDIIVKELKTQLAGKPELAELGLA